MTGEKDLGLYTLTISGIFGNLPVSTFPLRGLDLADARLVQESERKPFSVGSQGNLSNKQKGRCTLSGPNLVDEIHWLWVGVGIGIGGDSFV